MTKIWRDEDEKVEQSSEAVSNVLDEGLKGSFLGKKGLAVFND